MTFDSSIASHDWNAASYARVATEVHALGHALLDGLELRGDETVLDAGCGSGEVTAKLLDLLPRGRVIAVDASPAMVARAGAVLDPARTTTRVANLSDLTVDEPVDVVFSSATFHWIHDHDALFARLAAALKPDGRLVAQCGGAGNVTAVVEALRATVREPRFAAAGTDAEPWNFATPEQTVERLQRAGFADAGAGLHRADLTPEDPEDFIRTVLVGAQLERLAPADREPFVAAMSRRLGPAPTFHYVRLTMRARKPA
jgi:trans-aconitate 2-methyltransferase